MCLLVYFFNTDINNVSFFYNHSFKNSRLADSVGWIPRGYLLLVYAWVFTIFLQFASTISMLCLWNVFSVEMTNYQTLYINGAQPFYVRYPPHFMGPINMGAGWIPWFLRYSKLIFTTSRPTKRTLGILGPSSLVVGLAAHEEKHCCRL